MATLYTLITKSQSTVIYQAIFATYIAPIKSKGIQNEPIPAPTRPP